MYWMVLIYNYDDDGEITILDHNLDRFEAEELCELYRLDGYPAFIAKQTDYHERHSAETCGKCIREIREKFEKAGRWA